MTWLEAAPKQISKFCGPLRVNVHLNRTNAVHACSIASVCEPALVVGHDAQGLRRLLFEPPARSARGSRSVR